MYQRKHYYVYIMASDTGTLYIGVTNNVLRRSNEHKMGNVIGFTKKYNCNKLIYLEGFLDINHAISREKQLKGWNRSKKQALIKSQNPTWRDLSTTLEITFFNL